MMNDTERELKLLIIEALDLEDITAEEIDSNEPLFVEGLGLDSIDALELGLALQKKYGIKLEADSDETRKHFYNICSLAKLVNCHKSKE